MSVIVDTYITISGKRAQITKVDDPVAIGTIEGEEGEHGWAPSGFYLGQLYESTDPRFSMSFRDPDRRTDFNLIGTYFPEWEEGGRHD